MNHYKNILPLEFDKIKASLKNNWKVYLLRGSGVFFASALLFYLSIYLGLWGKIPSINELKDLKQSQATSILDVNNQLIGKYYIYDRQSIAYNDFPQHLIDALVATEDARFYEHHGIDTKSLFRVFFKTILTGDDASGGGSTITLQLAKNLYGRSNYGPLTLLVNKIKESIVARRIESIYSKKEILTFYLNTVPFPDNTFGIESAALKFFNEHTKALSVTQSATLIGSLKANHSFNPRLFPEKSKSRRNVVLQQMVKYGYLEADSASIAMEKPLILDYQHFAPNQGLAPYFREAIKKQLDSILHQNKYKKPNGKYYNLYRDGLKVYTTLDNTLQKYAEQAMKDRMAKLQKQYENAYGKNKPWLTNKPGFELALKRLKKYQRLKASNLSEKEILDSLSKPREQELFSWDGSISKSLSTRDSLSYYLKFLNTGLISMEPSTGAVRAYVGGIDYRYFQYDHVSQSKRQVGSTFKPIVYTAAIESGMNPCTYFSPKAVTYTDYEDWKPTNASVKDSINTLNYSLKYALSNSINTVAVKVLHETGIERVIDQAHAMGIKSNIESVPSIALGSSNLKVIELCEAYTSFVNESKPSKPVFIRKIETNDGKVLASYTDLNPKQPVEKAYSDATRQVMLEFLKATVNEGTARRLRSTYQFKNDIAGKTGTTQDNKDGWFVGILPQLVTVIWVGNDNQQIGFSNTAIGQGANSALPIFANYLRALNKDAHYNSLTKSSFETPSDKVTRSLDCPPTKKESFLERLFEPSPDKTEFNKKRKKGIFSWLFGKYKDE
ncbi:transglycosylase domain-containing protein [Gaetbulibacter aestuarii]|uniref:Transglycosylase domain-containing protein n=1 Tax=Gaetbulibacter aestuarii TaxID=1502358 RepID=A0ABW7MYK0_9FLAO